MTADNRPQHRQSRSAFRFVHAASVTGLALGLTVAAASGCGSDKAGSTSSPSSADSLVGDAGNVVADAGSSLAGNVAADAGGGPLLSSLSVAPLALVPAFSPGVQDYYVRCAAGTNTLTIAASVDAGATVFSVTPAVPPDGGPASSSLSGTLAISENAAVVLEASSSAGKTDYWIRCLPADFPSIVATSHPAVGTPAPGYYLMANISANNGENPYAMVVDANGVPVWYRKSPSIWGILNVEMLTPGVLSFTTYIDYTFSSVADGTYQRVQLTPWQVQTTNTVGIPLDHHELRVLSNGDYMMLSDVIRTGVDLTGYPSFGPGSSMIDCVIQEVSPAGAMVWQWDANDHFDPALDSTFPQSATTDSGVTVADPYHCNAIDVAANGDLLVSSRHMDSVFYVSKTTGAVVWKMGGSTFDKDGAAYVQVQGDPETAFYRQHDARFQPDGTISLFDDHTQMNGPARGAVYDVDASAGVAHLTWQCPGSVSSTAMGSLRRADDGTSVIGWGLVSSGTNLVMSEVDSACNDMLDIAFDAPNVSYRAVKVPLGAIDIGLLRTTAGQP
jgi:hypothetical protein